MVLEVRKKYMYLSKPEFICAVYIGETSGDVSLPTYQFDIVKTDRLSYYAGADEKE